MLLTVDPYMGIAFSECASLGRRMAQDERVA